MKRILLWLVLLVAWDASAKTSHLETDTMNLKSVLIFEEGFRATPYLCSEGYVTIGYGTKLHTSKDMNPASFPIKVTPTQAAMWLESDVTRMTNALHMSKYGHIFDSMNDDRRAILLSMSYQMGTKGVLKFRKMWAALQVKDYDEASEQALDSRWARQTASRAGRHARVLAGTPLNQVY